MGNDMTTDMPQCIQERCLARFDWQTENKKNADRSISTGWGWVPEEMKTQDWNDEHGKGPGHHEHTLDRYDRLMASSRQAGRDYGAGKASWIGDPRWTEEDWRRLLTGIEDCDPEVMDMYNEPNTSGEFADEMNGMKLQVLIGWDDNGTDPHHIVWDDIETAFVVSAQYEFWASIYRAGLKALGED